MNISAINWNNRNVFITGHTGFKGGWLALMLHRLGARLHGYALDPPSSPSLFETANIKTLLASDYRADLMDLDALKAAISEARAEVVFHLAAQPLVRRSYQDPVSTLTTNVMGTVHVLEAARASDAVKAMVLITTDKVYENHEWVYPYREIDPLGGNDLYSASKAAADLIAGSYRKSFFSGLGGHPARVATARAGNVIGGGDWGIDRLLPDCVKAFRKGQSAHLRNPAAVRPWQHVLEPLSGYLRLAEMLLGEEGEWFAKAWNFGPDSSGDATVEELARATATYWGESADLTYISLPEDPHEAGLLRLDSTLARTALDWHPRWAFEYAVERTVNWYQAWDKNVDMASFSIGQVDEYAKADGWE